MTIKNGIEKSTPNEHQILTRVLCMNGLEYRYNWINRKKNREKPINDLFFNKGRG
jgi:hypothetical protein